MGKVNKKYVIAIVTFVGWMLMFFQNMTYLNKEKIEIKSSHVIAEK